MFFNRINAANKLKAEMLKDEATELTNEQKKEIFEKSVMKAAKEQQMKNLHAKVKSHNVLHMSMCCGCGVDIREW